MTPAARIELNGKDRSAEWLARLVSITITDEAGTHSDACEVVLDAAPDDAAPNGFAAPPIGATFKVWLGYAPSPVFMGTYKVSGWSKEGPTRQLTIRTAAAELTSEIKAPKMRSHHDTTIGEIVEKIAADHSLKPLIDSDLAARPIAHIDQQTESDLGFLSRLAKRNGATFKIGDGNLIFTRKASTKTPAGSEKTPITIAPADVSTWSAEQGERGNYLSVVCCYMDHAAGRRVQVTAGSGKPCHRDRRLYGSSAEAAAAAKGQLADYTRGKLTADITGPGNPALFAEAVIALKGFDPDVDGKYHAKTVTHELTGSGYTTTLALEVAAT